MMYNDLDTLSASKTIVSTSREPLYPKFQVMFWIFAEALLVTILGLRCIEKGNKMSRILAMVGLGFGALSILLQLLLVWEVFPFLESNGLASYGLSTIVKITSFTAMTMAASIISALVMLINENEKMIDLLKIVAVFSCFGIWLIGSIMIFSEDFTDVTKFLNLEGVFSACFMTSWITALVMSKINSRDKFDKEAIKRDVKTQEMIQKMVEEDTKAEIEAKRIKAERDMAPPLQNDNMAPAVNHDNEVKISAPNGLNKE